MRNVRMTMHLNLLVTLLFVTASAMALGGCLDMPIIHVAKPTDAGDAGPPADASADGPAEAGPDTCETCVRAPSRPTYGCGDEMAACAMDPICFATMECAVVKGCFHLTGQGAIIDCGIPCGREAGLDITSPAVSLIFAVVACGQDKCGPICRGEVDASATR
jgi:hypothetical protein